MAAHRGERKIDAISVGCCQVQTESERVSFLTLLANPCGSRRTLLDFVFKLHVQVIVAKVQYHRLIFLVVACDPYTASTANISQYDIGLDSVLDPVLHSSDHPHSDPCFRPLLPVDAGKLCPPPLATWRMNLTALSQRFNLYFVAHEGDTFIYRPRNIRHTLPTLPDYVLKSKPVGKNTRGHIVPSHGHQVNNMVIGDLGDEEVLAMTFDNGNVIAYNVKIIANHITSLEQDPASWRGRSPQPFFHESVESSAWGLALHKKDRLIAVSCNLKYITVFFPALSLGNKAGVESSASHSLDIPRFATPEVSKVNHGKNNPRNVDYRVIYAPPNSDNIPAVDFTSTSDGHADKVTGIDIGGNICVFSVWESGSTWLFSISHNDVCPIPE